jgi:hypothetical protein
MRERKRNRKNEKRKKKSGQKGCSEGKPQMCGRGGGLTASALDKCGTQLVSHDQDGENFTYMQCYGSRHDQDRKKFT